MNNENNDIKNKLKIMINVFFETLTFIITLFLISCFLIAFQRELIKVLFFCLNINIIANFKNNIEIELGKKEAYILIAVSFIILIFFVYSFGYFEVSTNFTKL
ncbi:MAG: hypothetical protein MR314_04960 [Ezakiella sp.]|nr:hypothetical protein [Ezakiella sp.]